MRWARPGIGKRGGGRILYYYHDDDNPIALLTVYGKGDKDSLSKEERADFPKVTATIKQRIRDRQGRDLMKKEVKYAPQHRQRGT